MSDASNLNDIYTEKQYHTTGVTVVVLGGGVIEGSTALCLLQRLFNIDNQRYAHIIYP